MNLAERRRQDLGSSMDSLSLSSASSASSSQTKNSSKSSVADSWEEDASDSGGDTETEGPSVRSAMPGPPPPTPVTPGYKQAQTRAPPDYDFEDPYAVKDASARGGARGAGNERRQEKQTATASRLIAGALGVRAPKRTEEQRAYDKAVREKEQKKKDSERAEKKKAEEENDKARASVWED